MPYVHHDASEFRKSTGKYDKFGRPTYQVTCPKCGRVWISTNPTVYSCANRGGKKGCGYQFRSDWR